MDIAKIIKRKGYTQQHFTADNIDEFNKIVEEIKIIAK